MRTFLKEKSPSCGSNKTYDGSFTGNKREGTGVTAELLKQNGIKVYSEDNFPKDQVSFENEFDKFI